MMIGAVPELRKHVPEGRKANGGTEWNGTTWYRSGRYRGYRNGRYRRYRNGTGSMLGTGCGTAAGYYRTRGSQKDPGRHPAGGEIRGPLACDALFGRHAPITARTQIPPITYIFFRS